MITAKLNAYRQSPRKIRLVCDLVKGKSVTEALRLLSVTTKTAAKPLQKLIQSAVKNAKALNIDEGSLYIKDFQANAGATLKRSMPRARGSAFQILKRTSHVSLVLGERPTTDNKQPTTKIKKKSGSTPLSVVGGKL